MKLALFLAFTVVLLAGQCHGLFMKTREYYEGSQPSRQLRAYTVPAEIVILMPTMTEECDIRSCRRVVRSIQRNDMLKYPDLAENFVVGGCTGIFTAAGWNQISPISEKTPKPSVSIGVVGTYADNKVKPHVANTVKNLIKDGINKGKIDPNYKINFSNANGPVSTIFKEGIKEVMPEFEEYDIPNIEAQ